MFHDPQTNRLFYINKETEERTWKPPRHPNKHERAQQVMLHSCQGWFKQIMKWKTVTIVSFVMFSVQNIMIMSVLIRMFERK